MIAGHVLTKLGGTDYFVFLLERYVILLSIPFVSFLITFLNLVSREIIKEPKGLNYLLNKVAGAIIMSKQLSAKEHTSRLRKNV